MSLKFETIYDLSFDSILILHNRHGVSHRISYPAVIWQDGDVMWYEYGFLHRIDGPAKITQNKGTYYIRGERIK